MKKYTMKSFAQLCMCGHIKLGHTYKDGHWGINQKDEYRKCPCENFILDNLEYIEALAKERNLI